MDLYIQLQNKLNELDRSVKSLRNTGEEYAKAYTEYRIALAEELIRLKNKGVASTISYDIARGKREVAKLKYNEICKESIYKANLEAINAYKLEIRIIQNQIDKEYGNETSIN